MVVPAAQYARRNGIPVFFVPPGARSLPPAARYVLSSRNITKPIVLGDTAHVSASIYSELAAMKVANGAKAKPDRIVAADQYAMSEALFRYWRGRGKHKVFDTWQGALVTTGVNPYDACIAAALAGQSRTPVLLVPYGGVGANRVSLAINRRSITRLTILGGDTVVTPASRRKLAGVLGSPYYEPPK